MAASPDPPPPRAEAERAFRDAWFERLNRVLVLPVLLLGGWAVAWSPTPRRAAAVFGLYVAANMGLSVLAIRRHPLSEGAHARVFVNVTTLGAFQMVTGGEGWLLGVPTMFGGLFTLSLARAVYVQGSAVLGVTVGQLVAGEPGVAIGTAVVGLTTIALLAHVLYRPLERQYHEAHEQQREAELARQATQRALDSRKSFLATMSHEIRTPMNGMLGMAELLDDTPLSPKQRTMLRTILDCGDGLKDILDDVLDLSRLDAAALVTERRRYAPRELIDDVIGLMRQSGLSDAVSLTTDIGELPDHVCGDPRRLRQVLTNLLSNAIKFTPEGQIHVEVHHEDRRLFVAVEDTGVGFDPASVDRLFQPFEQADVSTTRQHGGSGLGLAIASRLVAAMGGRLEASSAPGKGSRFAFHVAAPRLTPTPTAAVPREATSLAAKVLLVDDNAVNLAVASAMLGKLGCTVVEASTGAEALDRVDASVDVVLMDCRMPEMDGFEATRQLRARGFSRPILAVTAGVTEEERSTCREAGMDAIVGKPFTLEALRAHLAPLVASKPET